MSPSAGRPEPPTAQQRVTAVRQAVRLIERFAYRAVSEAEGDAASAEARGLLRITVGLRRKLDNWRVDHGE